MRYLHFLYIISLLSLSSCEKEDKALVLPPPGNLTRVVANIDPTYDKQVFVSLQKNMQVTRNLKDWDLALEASANGFHVYLNSGKYMFACHTGATNFVNVDTVGKTWVLDNDHLDDDSTAIGNWSISGLLSGEVMVIDRGRIFYTGSTASQRYKKLRLEEVTPTSYRFSYCDFNSVSPIQFILPKNNDYSLMYFSFDNGGKSVDVAPKKNDWDLVFTRYSHTYFDQPLGSPYRYYLVSGGLSNRWNGITGLKLIKDSIPGYVDYEKINGLLASNFSFSTNADFIGFDWKTVDNSFNYLILSNRYYLLKDSNGFYYKVRFIDFYNTQGQTGNITFDYQRL